MTEALLLTASDFRPLREESGHILGALEAVEEALRAVAQGRIRGQHAVDRVEGEFEGIRLALLAGEGLFSGLRIFGNPPNTRAFALFDGVSRALLALMDYGVLNSLRVGATAGVAARHLSPTGALRMGLIGSGWQAVTQVLAVQAALPGLRRIRVFSPTPAHREAFAETMTERTGLEIEPAASVQQALRDADVIDLCAPGHHDVREPLFEPSWIRPGALVISMAPNQCQPEFVESAQLVAASWATFSGEPEPRPPYKQLIADGRITERGNFTALGSIIMGDAPPRDGSGDTVLYQLEGGTAQDLFVAAWGYQWAKARGVGVSFDLSR
ncbi:MAG: ornithine cyclodeaminase family protein [Chloroflexota bacterium]